MDELEILRRSTERLEHFRDTGILLPADQGLPEALRWALPQLEALAAGPRNLRWEDPRADDPWNARSYQGTTVAVLRIDPDQIVVRVYERELPDPWGRGSFESRLRKKTYAAIEVQDEGDGGASYGAWLVDSPRLDFVKENAARFIVGILAQRIRCGSCGRLMRVEYTNEAELRKHGLCHGCHLWRVERLPRKGDELVCIAEGTWYTIDPRESGPSSCKGFGGVPHVVTWKDGRERRTTNLWYGGKIPAHLLPLFPDTGRVRGDAPPLPQETPARRAIDMCTCGHHRSFHFLGHCTDLLDGERCPCQAWVPVPQPAQGGG